MSEACHDKECRWYNEEETDNCIQKDCVMIVHDSTECEKIKNELEKLKSQQSVLIYLHQQIKSLEMKTGCVVVVQFACHPHGLAFIFRAHQPSTGKEYTIPDAIVLSEIEDSEKIIPRLEVTFTEIHKALNSIQVIDPRKAKEALH